MKTTRLIGQRCKCSDTFSWLILIGRRFIHERTHTQRFEKDEVRNCYLVFREQSTLKKQDPVMMAQWPHLYPSRTQKLSTVAAKIAQANLARCRVIESMVFHRSPFFYTFYGFRLTRFYINNWNTLKWYIFNKCRINDGCKCN